MPYGGTAGGGALPSDNCRVGFFTYNDLATQSTPISHTGGVDTTLTCDELGPQTLKTFAPTGIADVWDASAGEFDFSEMSVGDMIDIRLDILVTTTVPNQEVVIVLEAAQGGSSYRVPFDQAFFKTAGEHVVDRYNGLYMGDSNTLDNPAQFMIVSDDDATIVINGWYCKVLIQG